MVADNLTPNNSANSCSMRLKFVTGSNLKRAAHNSAMPPPAPHASQHHKALSGFRRAEAFLSSWSGLNSESNIHCRVS